MWALLILLLMLDVSVASEERLIHMGVDYKIWKADPSKVRVIWLGESSRPLRTFRAVDQYLTNRNEKPVMLTNGGIFEPGLVPSGLLVQDGKTLHHLNRKEGKGNFFLKPNGIFQITDSGAEVIDSIAYLNQEKSVKFAVQSGPLLLKNGMTHPAFNKDSRSRLLRSGIGVDPSGKVVFAISQRASSKQPNFYEFADLFRRLGCQNALFLDGTISQIVDGNHVKSSNSEFASIIAVVE